MTCNLKPARYRHAVRGFTLVELAIVLVIIALLIGGVLVGEDMIRAAQTSSQLSQIEKYDSATGAFRTKYNNLPGDLPVDTATSLGWAGQRPSCDGVNTGKRNGDGLIDGWPGATMVYSQTVGETALFWEDLSSAGLIDGTYPQTGQFDCSAAKDLGGTYPAVSTAFPAAKIGSGNFVYVIDYNEANWFGIAAFTAINHYGGMPTTTPNIRVGQAYNMDKKVDDGMPTTGTVQAMYITGDTAPLTNLISAPNGVGTAICYNTTTMNYAVGVQDGSGQYCALIFRFQ